MTSSLMYFGVTDQKTIPSIEKFHQEGPSSPSYWLHFSVEDPTLSRWVEEKSGIDPLLFEPMLTIKVRSKFLLQGNSILLILRVADTLDVEEYESLRSLRIYADKNRVITTSPNPLPVIQSLLKKWRKMQSVQTTATDFLVDLCEQSVRGLEVILEDLEDQTDVLEKQVLSVGEDPSDLDITVLTLDGLHIRRYLAPQREILARLIGCELLWLGTMHRKKIREIYEKVSRQLNETEVMRDRSRIIREQFNSHVAEQMNHRLYVFSVIAAIFIPLGFLTGLFGVNLGGIPGAEHGLGFPAFCAALVGCTLVMILAFKRLNWL